MSEQPREKDNLLEEQDSLGDVVDEDVNGLYDLLDANSMSTSVTFHHQSTNDLSQFSFADFDQGGVESSDNLNNSPSANLYREEDIYRSAAVETRIPNLSSHLDFGLAETNSLDRPFELLEPKLANTNKNAVINVPSPRMCCGSPFQMRLEHTHIYVKIPVQLLVDEIAGILKKRQDCDSMFDGESCFFRGMYYPKQPLEAVDFRLHINSTPLLGLDQDRYLVEMVRRSGCSMAFHDLFFHLQRELCQIGAVTLETGGEPVLSVQELPSFNAFPSAAFGDDSEDEEDDDFLPRPVLSRSVSSSDQLTTFFSDECTDSEFGDDEEYKFCSDAELFSPIVELCKSPNADLHCQGLSLVSMEFQNKDHCVRMVKACPEIVRMLIEFLAVSTHREVRRNSATALCTLATLPEMHQTILEHCGEKILADVAALEYCPSTVETMRQSAEALGNLCNGDTDALKAVFQQVHDKGEIFQKLAVESGDTRFATAVSKVRNAMEVF